MAKLRMERLLREQAEKTKAMVLLNPDYIDPAVHHQPAGRYNQQFNPQATTHAQSTFRSHHGDRDGRNDHRKESRVSRSPEDRESHESRYRSNRDDRHRRDRDSSSREEDRYRVGHEDKHRRSRGSTTVRTEVVITRIGTQAARAAVDGTGTGTETEILAGYQEAITDSHSKSGQH